MRAQLGVPQRQGPVCVPARLPVTGTPVPVGMREDGAVLPCLRMLYLEARPVRGEPRPVHAVEDQLRLRRARGDVLAPSARKTA